MIDYTGGSAFGEWLEENARQAEVFTEKSGVNAMVLHSTDDFVGMCDNLAFTLALYSGQMCTTTQNFFIPADGIQTEQGPKSVEDVAASIGGAIERLLGEDRRAVELLGAIAAARSPIGSTGRTGSARSSCRAARSPTRSTPTR